MFDSEKLIIAVESRPCLWNNGDASYSNRSMRKIAWEQIGEEFYEDWSTYSAKKKNETSKFIDFIKYFYYLSQAINVQCGPAKLPAPHC